MKYSDKENFTGYDENQKMKESSNKYIPGSMDSTFNNPKKLTRADAHVYEKKIQDLSEKIEILEGRLKNTSDNKIKIIERLKNYEDENERMKDQIARQASNNQRLNDDLDFKNKRINELTNTNKNVNDKCKTKFEILNKELEEKENNLEKLISQIKAKDETIKYFSVNNEHTVRNQNFYKDELENLKKINKLAEDKIHSLEVKIGELHINSKSESALLLEIEHLKDDNVRLLKMLKTTEEFKDFAYLAENVSGGIKFIKSSNETIKKSKNLPFCEQKKAEREDPFNGDNWVPSEAYNFAYEFKNKYKIEMSDNLINDLLSALNKIWRDREAKQISRLKTKYQSEIMGLRRKANMKSNYDEFTSVKTISKLKKDLKNVRDDLRGQIVEKNKLKNTPAGIDLVDNALKVASNFQMTKKHLENEIKILKNKLASKDDKTESENFERLKFNEGSFWMIERVLQEYQNLESCLEETYNEFEDRIKNIFPGISSNDLLDFNVKIFTNSKKWYYQSMKEIIEDVKSKFLKWHYDIQKNFDSLKY